MVWCSRLIYSSHAMLMTEREFVLICLVEEWGHQTRNSCQTAVNQGLDILRSGLNKATKKSSSKRNDELRSISLPVPGCVCVLSTAQLDTHAGTHSFWQTSAPSHTSLMFRNKYLRMRPGSQIVSWKPDVIYTSFWCRLILPYTEVERKGNKW